MITLTNAHIWKYKCIDDSSRVDISDTVTVLVGKNESGKSAFLEALHKARPLEDAKFDPIYDYPRKDFVKYQRQHSDKSYAKVVTLTFLINDDLIKQINNEVFDGDDVFSCGCTFTKTVTYGNTASIDLRVNEAKALTVFRKALDGIEQTAEVFATAKTLDDVIGHIEAKELPNDSSLVVFAAKWRERFAKAPKNWGILCWYVYDTYLRNAIPRFIYFDDYRLLDGKINLDALSKRMGSNSLSEADQTATGLFDLAGIRLDELISEEGYENSKAKLEAIGLSITHDVFKYWKQNRELSVEFDIKNDPKDQPPYNNGKNLYIRIKNGRHGVTVPFDQRSKGFIWFFSFIAWFSAIQNRMETDKPLVLLLDEPGLNLHALAQRDFLSYIDYLAQSHQVIYTTHSPFMVAPDRLERVRVVEDRVKEGSTVTSRLEGASEDSLFPLQAALGYSIAQNLFIAKKNVLIEGPADLLFLQHMSSLLERQGKIGLEEGVFTPVGGLDNVATFVALLGANDLKIVVLHDRGKSPYQRLEELIHEKLIARKQVLDYSMFREPDNIETDIEDLFPESLYIEAFNKAYAKELGGDILKSKDLPKHPRIIERIERWLKSKEISLRKKGGFNHYRVAQALLPRLTETTISADEMGRFEKIFQRVNRALS